MTYLKIYNSTLKKKITLIKRYNFFKIYCCGPTVYSWIHLGNFRTFILNDILYRLLILCGYNPLYIRNITDIDDKILALTIQKKTTIRNFTNRWIYYFKKDYKILNLLIPDYEPLVTKYIKNQIVFIQELINTYFLKRSIYLTKKLIKFSLWKFPTKFKENRYYQKKIYLWRSPWGFGRPSWHSSCSVLNLLLFKRNIDIHSGGIDLKKPHHENEKIQFELFSKLKFTHNWVYVNHLFNEQSKMSKSLNNTISMVDLMCSKFNLLNIKLFFLISSYAKKQNFWNNTFTKLKTTADTLNLFFEKLNLNEKVYRINPKKNFSKWYLFKKAYIFLTDDLNTNSCIYEIINIIKKINITGLSFTKKKHLQTSFRQLMFLLGLEKCFIFKKKNIRKYVINFIIKRWQLKKKFNYFRSDSLRKKLLMLGWEITDLINSVYIKKL